MFELIRANKRRSMMLMMIMLALLLVLGFLIGAALVPSVGQTRIQGERVVPGFAFDPTGGFIGMGVAFCIWIFQSLIAYYQGGQILLAVSGAKPIEHQDHPQLYNVVEEMSIAAQLPKPPQVYIINDMAMNAFATGRSPDHCAVAVTAGLLSRLNRDQLQGVVAHEISHIVNRDVLFMTMIGIMVGSIVMISEVFLRSLWYGAGSSRRYRSDSKKGGGGAQAIIMVLAIILAILAPILAQFIYFACSRRREYLADAGAAVYTRYPEGLASALEAISGDTHELGSVNRATAPMYISNPLEKGMALHLTSTHPPIQERIRILRNMAGGASYRDYQSAWAKTSGNKAGHVPNSALKDPGAPIRDADPDAARQAKAQKDPKQQMREAGDLLRKVNQFIFLPCVCGMRLKLPPEFKQDHVQCPRCKRTLEVPVAQLVAVGAAGEMLSGKAGAPPIPMAQAQAAPPPLEVTRSGQEWMSFKCPCGAVKNLAPSFSGSETTCAKCGRTIRIRNG